MALNFPSTPTNGQIHTEGGKSWVYDSSITAWRSQSVSGGTGGGGGVDLSYSIGFTRRPLSRFGG